MPIPPRFQRVVFPSYAYPAIAPPVGEEILVRELVGVEEGFVRVDEFPEGIPGFGAGVEDEEPGVEERVGLWVRSGGEGTGWYVLYAVEDGGGGCGVAVVEGFAGLLEGTGCCDWGGVCTVLLGPI